jgi:heme-degrading monooxygenase HmoA
MYAVIFKAKIDFIDEAYLEMAARMRELAIKNYGCTGFTSCTEGENEIAISYWPSKELIQVWKNDPEHQQAQALGKAKWYKFYQVQVVEVLNEYGTNT